MKRIVLYADSGYIGASHQEVIEVPDDTPESDLQEMAEAFMNEHIDWGYYEEEGDDEEEEDPY